MGLASPGALVELGMRGTGWRECVGVCTPTGRFAPTCRAGSAEHRVGARGYVGAQGGKGVYLVPGCLCVYVWSVQACVMSAQGLQAGGANSVCVDPLEPGCVSTRVFTCVRVGAPMSRTVKVAHVQDRSMGLWERRGTPGEALAGTEDTRQGWIYRTECSP